MINLNKMKVGNRYILTLRDGDQLEMTCCNKYNDYVNFGYSNWNVYFDGKYKDQDIPSLDIVSYCEAPFTEAEELRQQLQAKEEEVEQLKLENTQLKYKLNDLEEIRVRLQLRLNDESRKEFSKSLQTKLQQAKESLEFYAKAKHFEDHSYYDIMLEWGQKARETLEMINKE